MGRYRKPVNRRQSRKNFRRGSKINKRNFSSPMRGGIRI